MGTVGDLLVAVQFLEFSRGCVGKHDMFLRVGWGFLCLSATETSIRSFTGARACQTKPQPAIGCHDANVRPENVRS